MVDPITMSLLGFRFAEPASSVVTVMDDIRPTQFVTVFAMRSGMVDKRGLLDSIPDVAVSRLKMVAGDNLGKGFALIDPNGDKRSFETVGLCKLNGCMSDAVGIDYPDKKNGFVPSLLKNAGPTTIGRLIVSVIVDAVERMLLGRFWSHVSDEVVKAGGSKPALANRNASAAVSMVSRHIGIVAAVFHSRPRLEQRVIVLCHAQGFITRSPALQGEV